MDDEFYGRMRRAVVTAGCFVVNNWPWFVGVAAVYFLFAGDLIARFVGYERTDLSPGLRLLHDVAIASIALFGLMMAFWRNSALDRQSKAAAKTAAHSRDRMENDQFKEAIELLGKKGEEGNAEMSARVGGIYILRDLAMHEERWPEFAPQAIRVLMAYIKENVQRTVIPMHKGVTAPGNLRQLGGDTKAAFVVLEEILNKRGKALEEKNLISGKSDLTFDSQNFSGLVLGGDVIPNWSRYSWERVDFRGTYFQRAKISGADFFAAFFEGADFMYAKIQGTRFSCAKIHNASFSPAKLRGINLRDATFSQPDPFRGAKVEVVCHTNQKELKGIEGIANDVNWGEILREFADDGGALAGMLRNFGNIDADDPLTEPGRKLREEMINMLNENRMPDDFPFWAEGFLRGLNPNGTDKKNQTD